MTLLIASLTLVGALAAGPSQPVATTARVSGQVIEDGTNAPVAGARVFVIPDAELSTPAGPLPATLSDRDGFYHLDALPAGRYRIAVQKTGFAPPMDPSTMQVLEVTAGQVVDALTVTIQRGGVIAGRVLDPSGQPLAEAQVTALLKRLDSGAPPQTSAGMPVLMPHGQGQTNDLGEFRIFGLSPGEYLVSASPRTDHDGAYTSRATTIEASTFFPGTTDVAAAQAVKVRAGETASAVTIQLIAVPAFEISGVVVDDAGAPVAGVMVMILTGATRGRGARPFMNIEPGGMVPSDDAGRFTFAAVPAGFYTLRALGGGGGIGAFTSSEEVMIGPDGIPRADPNSPKPPVAPGSIEVTVEHANVRNLKLVMPKSP